MCPVCSLTFIIVLCLIHQKLVLETYCYLLSFQNILFSFYENNFFFILYFGFSQFTGCLVKSRYYNDSTVSKNEWGKIQLLTCEQHILGKKKCAAMEDTLPFQAFSVRCPLAYMFHGRMESRR